MGEWGDRLTGIIFVVGGAYCFLCGCGILRSRTDKAKADSRYHKYKMLEKIIGLVLIGYGAKELLGL